MIDTQSLLWLGMLRGMADEGAVYQKHTDEAIFFLVKYAAAIKFGDKLQRARDAYQQTYGLKLMIKYEAPPPKEIKIPGQENKQRVQDLFKNFFK